MMIRTATAEDAPALERMVRWFIASTQYGRYLDVDETLLRALIDHALTDGLVLVAVEAERVVGMLAILRMIHPVSGVLEAGEIAWWMDPEHRRGTAAPRMLALAERWARDKSVRMLKMVAPAGADNVAAFYRARGYEPLETTYVKLLE